MKEQCTLETIKPGDCANFPQVGDTVRVHYEGFLGNGSMFDSSRERGQPLEFKLGSSQVITGWEESIPKMSRGQIAKLTVPSYMGYGASGYPPIIPPNATLEFEIELISFLPKS